MYEILSHLELSQYPANQKPEILKFWTFKIKILRLFCAKFKSAKKNSKVDIVFDTDLQFLSMYQIKK